MLELYTTTVCNLLLFIIALAMLAYSNLSIFFILHWSACVYIKAIAALFVKLIIFLWLCSEYFKSDHLYRVLELRTRTTTYRFIKITINESIMYFVEWVDSIFSKIEDALALLDVLREDFCSRPDIDTEATKNIFVETLDGYFSDICNWFEQLHEDIVEYGILVFLINVLIVIFDIVSIVVVACFIYSSLQTIIFLILSQTLDILDLFEICRLILELNYHTLRAVFTWLPQHTVAALCNLTSVFNFIREFLNDKQRVHESITRWYEYAMKLGAPLVKSLTTKHYLLLALFALVTTNLTLLADIIWLVYGIIRTLFLGVFFMLVWYLTVLEELALYLGLEDDNDIMLFVGYGIGGLLFILWLLL